MTTTLSFDIEEFDFPIERGKTIAIKEQLDISSDGLEYILDTLSIKNLKATFYVTANFANLRPTLVKKIVDAGHEVASHDYFHSMESGSKAAESRTVLQKLTGQEIVGYRAPRLSAGLSTTLVEAGFKYDSSVNPTFIPGRYNNLTHPRRATIKNGLTIYPVSVAYPIRIPLFWLALHIMPLFLYKYLASTAIRHDKNLSLYFHPWEFSDSIKSKEFGIPFYITSCCGTKYRKKFENLLDYLIKKGITFKTTREYLHI